MSQIEINGLSKNFGNTEALSNIHLELASNKIYGLLGRNGAGTTTLLNLITNKLFPDSGQILIDGNSTQENDHVQGKIYCMAEKSLHPENMKVKDAFKWTREFYHDFDIAYAKDLAAKFELKIDKKIKTLSTGYASIFKMILALASNAEIILFDEPVLGLDANHRDMFYRELMANYSLRPKTVIISTHLIEEATNLLEDVIILKDGHVLLTSNVAELLSKGFTVCGPTALVDEYIVGKNLLAAEIFGGLKTASLLEESNIADLPKGLELSKLDLQKLFIHLTNA